MCNYSLMLWAKTFSCKVCAAVAAALSLWAHSVGLFRLCAASVQNKLTVCVEGCCSNPSV